MPHESLERADNPLPPTPGKPGEPPPTVADIPVVIGILVAYALHPFVSALTRVKIPRSIGAGLVILAFLAVLGVGAYSLSGQAIEIVKQVPEAAQRIRERVRHRDHQGSAIGEVQ